MRVGPSDGSPASCALLSRGSPVSHTDATLSRVDERVLTERLVTYDTSTAEGLHAAAGFVKGWLEARDIDVEAHRFGDLHALTASVGAEGAPTIVFHGHLDVVPGRPEQFSAADRRRPAVRPRRLRHEGRARGDDARRARPDRRRGRAGAARDRARRGVRGHRDPLERRPGAPRLRRRLRDHRRADQPAHRHPGQGRAGDAGARARARRPRVDALARRQRDREGGRRLPPNRVVAVLARVLRAVRPAVDQPRADRRRATRRTRSPTRA